MKIRAAVVGGAGYEGGELIRLLLSHPEVSIENVTSENFTHKFVSDIHPNLRAYRDLKFISVEDLQKVDILFSTLPNLQSASRIDFFNERADKIVVLGADFRIQDPDAYVQWYDHQHSRPELLNEFIYGLPELHRERIKKAAYVSGPGCIAASALIPLAPLIKAGCLDLSREIIIDAKVGSSTAGSIPNRSSHHPERSGAVRSFKPVGHRHSAEIEQELAIRNAYLSVTSVELVRGILTTIHTFLKENIKEIDIWEIYRNQYRDEPFVRLVRKKTGIYRYPEPKILIGTNFCDIGFKIEERTRRLVVLSALDNLGKGGAGNAVQCMNLLYDNEEKLGLEFPGLHPI